MLILMKLTDRTKIVDIDTAAEKSTIYGWVFRERTHGNVRFILVRDGTGVIQCVHHPDLNPQVNIPANLGVESAVKLSGSVRADSRAPGGMELEISDFELISPSQAFPITRDQSVEFLLDNRHLWLRSRKQTQLMELKAGCVGAARQWFADNKYVEVFPPILVGGACEGGSTLFELDYFDKKAYLSQSVQLYLEALIYSLEDVYAITPSFRAEKSRTPRHLAEYWHIEAESTFMDMDDIMSVEERLFAFICNRASEKYPDLLRDLGRDPDYLAGIKAPFKKISYDEAFNIVQSEGGEMKFGEDFGSKEERIISTHFDHPFFIHTYPIGIKPFYVKEDPNKPGFVYSADLMAPEGYGEMTTGGAREEDLDSIVKRIKAEGFKPEDYGWYLDLRKYGSVPHAGFGLGSERLVWWLAKQEHIRDATAFPRVLNRIYP